MTTTLHVRVTYVRLFIEGEKRGPKFNALTMSKRPTK